MKFNEIMKINLPDEFPDEQFFYLMESTKSILLLNKDDSWKKFSGASNLIGWRFRACYEDMSTYIESWVEHGANVSFEEIYMRERVLFGMFSSGVSCIESACYAVYALASHHLIYSLPFGEKEQRKCNPRSLSVALEPFNTAKIVVDELNSIIQSNEWKFWVDLRNRMTHRSNIPRIIRGAVGGSPPPAKVLQFAATSSTPAFEADEDHLVNLFKWLAQSLGNLLAGGGEIATKP
jgi:hypothetical protein